MPRPQPSLRSSMPLAAPAWSALDASGIAVLSRWCAHPQGLLIVGGGAHSDKEVLADALADALRQQGVNVQRWDELRNHPNTPRPLPTIATFNTWNVDVGLALLRKAGWAPAALATPEPWVWVVISYANELCPHCRRPASRNHPDAGWIADPSGCMTCKGRGHRARVWVSETLEMTAQEVVAWAQRDPVAPATPWHLHQWGNYQSARPKWYAAVEEGRMSHHELGQRGVLDHDG